MKSDHHLSYVSARRHSCLDYAITVSRRLGYFVVSSPDFGFQVSANCVGIRKASPEEIGSAVFRVMAEVQRRLSELDQAGEAHPTPIPVGKLFGTEILPPREAARILGVSLKTLRRMAYLGQIKSIRTPGGHLRFSLDAILSFLTSGNTDDKSGFEGVA